MSRGKKLTDEQRQAVLGVYQVTGTVYHTAKQLKMPLSTVHRILRQAGVTAPGAAQRVPSPPLLPVPVPEVPSHAARPSVDVEADIRAQAWPRFVAPAADVLDTIYARLAVERSRPGGPDTKVTSSLMTELYRGALSLGILVDKARLLNDRSTSIIAKQRELEDLPAGMTREFLVEAIRVRIRTAAQAHAGLLPEAVPDGG